MERRVLLAIFLCFLVLYIWQTLVVKPVPKPTAGTAPQQTASDSAVAGSPAGTPSPTPQAPPQAEKEAPPPEAGPPAAVVVGDAGERDIRLETPNAIVVFTNRGARLKSWKLKHYLDAQ